MRISPVKRNSLSERAIARGGREAGPIPKCKRKTSTDCAKKIPTHSHTRPASWQRLGPGRECCSGVTSQPSLSSMQPTWQRRREREAACCGATAVRNEQPTDYEWSGQPGRPTWLRTAATAEAHIDCSIMPAVIPSGVRQGKGKGGGEGEEGVG